VDGKQEHFSFEIQILKKFMSSGIVLYRVQIVWTLFWNVRVKYELMAAKLN
jgi:hypothetical protein